MKLFKRTNKKLSVEEAKDKLYNEISKNINWKNPIKILKYSVSASYGAENLTRF